MGGIYLITVRLTTNHSQCLNSGSPFACCEWLWSIGLWSNRALCNIWLFNMWVV